MSYKITKRDEAYNYTAPGHFDCRTTRLHDPGDVNQGGITMGLTHFLPGGGTELGSNPKESIYYIIHGQMEIETYDDEGNALTTTLYAGDSWHCGPGTKKKVTNTGATSSQMLVAMTAPAAE